MSFKLRYTFLLFAQLENLLPTIQYMKKQVMAKLGKYFLHLKCMKRKQHFVATIWLSWDFNLQPCSHLKSCQVKLHARSVSCYVVALVR